MLPGKKYTPEDVLLILYRRMWLVLVPFAVISAATAVYVRRLPDLYESKAVIMVQPPRISEGLVQAAAPTKLEDRLPAIEQQVLSRTRLERIVVDLDLFPAERHLGIMEDVVDRVRNAVNVQVIRGDTFEVSYTGGDPRTVMKVADRISSLLMEESTRDRELLMQGQDQFLETQLEEARRQLVDHEKKVEDYRRKYAGQLPAQTNSNLQAAQSSQTQILTIVNAMDRDQERRLLLERQISDLQNAPEDQSVALPSSGPGSTTTQQLAAARAQLAQMQLRLTPQHPDVQQAKTVVRDLEAKLEAESRDAPLSADGGRVSSPAEQSRLSHLADLQAQMAELDRQLARQTADVQRLRQVADGYQQRAEAGPTRETEMTELNRDYATLQGMYTSLLQKKEEASLASDLERRQIGQQFKILDQASLPSRPFSPNRQRLNMMGMVAGLGVGLAIIALFEYRSVSMQTDDELTTVLALPVLAVVPVMESDADRRRRTRWRLVTQACFGGVVLGCFGILAYTLVR